MASSGTGSTGTGQRGGPWGNHIAAAPREAPQHVPELTYMLRAKEGIQSPSPAPLSSARQQRWEPAVLSLHVMMSMLLYNLLSPCTTTNNNNNNSY
ncbi:unnamed protein product [Lota lota]